MKLIELLARELKEWPEGVLTIDQSIVDGELYGRNLMSHLIWRSHANNALVVADDAKNAKINNRQWLDAKLHIVPSVAMAQLPPSDTPTLETMLAEWRDLEARAQAAQAEANALFEHAGQCHGEIVVRLAELGWGAPRAPMVPGKPVVTLDDGWIEWNGGAMTLDGETPVDVKFRDGFVNEGSRRVKGWEWSHTSNPRDIVAYRLTPSTPQ